MNDLIINRGGTCLPRFHNATERRALLCPYFIKIIFIVDVNEPATIL